MTTTLAAAADATTTLVSRAASGDRAAFERLIGERLDALYRTAWAILRDEAEARDATQEALVACWRELPRLREQDRFDAWLQRILVNRCRTAIRSSRRRPVRRLELVDEQIPVADGAGGEPSPDQVADDDAIRRAFARLRAEPRAILVMHHVDGRPVAEIAAVLGIPEGTAKWRLHDARRALERALAEEAR